MPQHRAWLALIASLPQGALNSIIKETTEGDNAAVGATANVALDSVNKAQDAVESILKAILTNETPERSEYAPLFTYST